MGHGMYLILAKGTTYFLMDMLRHLHQEIGLTTSGCPTFHQ